MYLTKTLRGNKMKLIESLKQYGDIIYIFFYFFFALPVFCLKFSEPRIDLQKIKNY